jgi:type II secretory pathway pseudopilin PulG
VAIIGILVGILVPALAIARQLAQLGACKGNIKSIHGAIKLYEAGEDRLPRLRRSPVVAADVNNAPTGSTDDDYDETGDEWADLGDQAMQNVWLMIANGNLGETAFKCPGDGEWDARPSGDGKYGWTTAYQYSYGLQWPYDDDGANDNGAPFTAKMKDDLVIMADAANDNISAGDGIEEDSVQDGDSDNHGGHGVVVVTWSGTVNSHKGDSLAGAGGDDIYSGGETDPTAGTMPTDADTDDYEGRKDTSIALSGR